MGAGESATMLLNVSLMYASPHVWKRLWKSVAETVEGGRLHPGEPVLTVAPSSPFLCCRGPGSHFEVSVSCPLRSDPLSVPEVPHPFLAPSSEMARGTAPFALVT